MYGATCERCGSRRYHVTCEELSIDLTPPSDTQSRGIIMRRYPSRGLLQRSPAVKISIHLGRMLLAGSSRAVWADTSCGILWPFLLLGPVSSSSVPPSPFQATTSARVQDISVEPVLLTTSTGRYSCPPPTANVIFPRAHRWILRFSRAGRKKKGGW